MDEAVNACEVGYILSKDYWGQGLMTEALKAVLHFLLHRSGIQGSPGQVCQFEPCFGKCYGKSWDADIEALSQMLLPEKAMSEIKSSTLIRFLLTFKTIFT